MLNKPYNFKFKFVIILFLIVLFVSFASATDYFKIDTPIDLKTSCTNSSGNLCSTSALCNVTSLKYPNNSILISSGVMSASLYPTWNYTLTGLNVLGEYEGIYFCCESNVCGSKDFNFIVTKNGIEPISNGMEILIYVLFLISSAGLILLLVFNLVKLATISENILGVILNWLALLLMFVVYYVSNNYMLDNYVSDISSLLIDITKFTNGLLPIISFVIAFIIRSFEKKKPLTPQEVTGRITFNG